MPRARLIFCTVFLTSILSFKTHASTILVVTDQVGAQKARDVVALFRATKPFSQMPSLKFKVIQTTSTKLGCSGAKATAADLFAITTADTDSEDLLRLSEARDRKAELGIAGLPASCDQKGGVPTRLISCETSQSKSFLGALKRTESAKYIVVVKTDSRYGGSGGTYPVITTGSPPSMAIHELMHRLGFADEYGYYNTCEADIYCPNTADSSTSPSGYGSMPKTAFNIAVFDQRPKYTSNNDVRNAHGAKIPWLRSIAAATNLQAKGKLGTPTPGDNGLYRAIVCDLATRKMETWQSTSTPTIMKTLSTTYVPTAYWPTLEKSLGTSIQR